MVNSTHPVIITVSGNMTHSFTYPEALAMFQVKAKREGNVDPFQAGIDHRRTITVTFASVRAFVRYATSADKMGLGPINMQDQFDKIVIDRVGTYPGRISASVTYEEQPSSGSNTLVEAAESPEEASDTDYESAGSSNASWNDSSISSASGPLYASTPVKPHPLRGNQTERGFMPSLTFSMNDENDDEDVSMKVVVETPDVGNKFLMNRLEAKG